ncbi:hypothetical protein R5H30_01620 [Sulfitobacter sp. D35]|uniref:hypothetical protein n=1 Tax=Sulfitobacter sp. D35 TaxID=3083252 RepID=UPI00296FD7E6|nr:hypothetical protein [Sulfitobacter sp. D35]MDW4496664.1 hypothetical protein [Sulfitobacter sp. D35]
MSKRRGYFDVQSPVFRPLWRRIAVVAVTLGWALFELSNGATGWALVFGLAGLWCAWQFFVAWEDPEETEADDG